MRFSIGLCIASLAFCMSCVSAESENGDASASGKLVIFDVNVQTSSAAKGTASTSSDGHILPFINEGSTPLRVVYPGGEFTLQPGFRGSKLIPKGPYELKVYYVNTGELFTTEQIQ